MHRTARQIAQEICLGWVKSNWDTYEDWLNSESLGVGLWEREIADITVALKEYAARAVAIALEGDDEKAR